MMTTPPPTPRGVVVTLTTTASNGDYKTSNFTLGNEWEYNSTSPSRLTILDINRNKIAEFPIGCFTGVRYGDTL